MSDKFSVKNLYDQSNCYFQFRSNFLVTDSQKPKDAVLQLKIGVCFFFNDKKKTLLNEGDSIKFIVVPYSKVHLFEENNSESLKEIPKNDPEICSFSCQVSKENTLHSSQFDRLISIEEKIHLSEKDTTYVVKGEAYKNGELVSVNFLFTELMKSFPSDFHQFFKSYDFFSHLREK